MTQEGTPTVPTENKDVPRPSLTCFATQLGVAKTKIESLGDTATIVVESGDLEIHVHFPLAAADKVGKELSALQSRIKVVDAGGIAASGIDLSKLRNGDGPKR